MPTLDELKGLYKSGAGYHNLTPLLKATSGTYLRVWSGKTKGSWFARSFGFDDGGRHLTSRDFSDSRRAFAVRSRGDG